MINKELLHKVRDTARSDFEKIKEEINSKNEDIQASVNKIRYVSKDNVLTATCDFSFSDSNEVIEASVNYKFTNEGIFADSTVSEVSDAILSTVSGVAITAADDDTAFSFEDDELLEPSTDVDIDEQEDSDVFDLSEEEMEDPEEAPNIDNDNNIAGHYIAECSRCKGIFISALIESDQQVESITGVCPLCEKESDQYIKWVIKPVEF